MVPEVLGERDYLGVFRPKVNMIASHSNGLRHHSRHQTRSRRIADCLLAIGAIESKRRFSEGIDMGTMDVAGSVASQFRTQIIDRDEQQIGLLGRSCVWCRRRCQYDTGRQQ